jgi:predicted lactoylglutathione lyase
MHKQIFVNLPVRDLAKSRAFYERLGYSFNPEYSNDKGACMLLGENLHVMLLTREFFGSFIERPVGDTSQQVSAIVCVNLDTKAKVDDLVARAVAGGAIPSAKPQDHGFMYEHGYYDLDGHAWSLVHFADQTATA